MTTQRKSLKLEEAAADWVIRETWLITLEWLLKQDTSMGRQFY
jgi:hypothetical protein